MKKEFLGIQYLRGFAAMSVVFFHLSVQQHFMHPDWTYSALSENLRSGVDLFFVISGFIMICSTDFGRTVTAAAFLWRRLLRIAPLYWTATAAMVLVVATAPQLVQQSSVLSRWHVIASFLFLPAEHPTAQNTYAPIVFVGWTLNYEMFFYAVFAAGILVSAGKHWLFIICVCTPIVFLALAGFILRGGGTLGFYTNPVMLEFVFGMLGAAVVRRMTTGLLGYAIFALALLALLFLPASDDFTRSFRYGLPAFLMVIYASLIRWPEQSTLHTIGNASYSIYVTHFFWVSAFVNVWKHLVGTTGGWLSLLLYYLVGSTGALATGILCWFAFERPVEIAIRSYFRPRPALA